MQFVAEKNGWTKFISSKYSLGIIPCSVEDHSGLHAFLSLTLISESPSQHSAGRVCVRELEEKTPKSVQSSVVIYTTKEKYTLTL